MFSKYSSLGHLMWFVPKQHALCSGGDLVTVLWVNWALIVSFIYFYVWLQAVLQDCYHPTGGCCDLIVQVLFS